LLELGVILAWEAPGVDDMLFDLRSSPPPSYTDPLVIHGQSRPDLTHLTLRMYYPKQVFN
ncbi:hypothetical protein U1Q18_039573, partial [Sarracenia purpurea var. burkii]